MEWSVVAWSALQGSHSRLRVPHQQDVHDCCAVVEREGLVPVAGSVRPNENLDAQRGVHAVVLNVDGELRTLFEDPGVVESLEAVARMDRKRAPQRKKGGGA